jgi:hypothetical protein
MNTATTRDWQARRSGSAIRRLLADELDQLAVHDYLRPARLPLPYISLWPIARSAVRIAMNRPPIDMAR